MNQRNNYVGRQDNNRSANPYDDDQGRWSEQDRGSEQGRWNGRGRDQWEPRFRDSGRSRPGYDNPNDDSGRGGGGFFSGDHGLRPRDAERGNSDGDWRSDRNHDDDFRQQRSGRSYPAETDRDRYATRNMGNMGWNDRDRSDYDRGRFAGSQRGGEASGNWSGAGEDRFGGYRPSDNFDPFGDRYPNSGNGSRGFAGDQSSRGRHYGTGPKGYSRSDDRIREDVCDCLTDDDDLDASNIEVKVSGGEVTLTGEVESRRYKRRAEDLAERVRGVTDVHNQIRNAKQSAQNGESSTTKQSTQSRAS